MNIFFETHHTILSKLLEHDVEFIMVGGYAVIFHGYTRTTGDLDIWLKPNNDNKERLVDALQELDFDEVGIGIIESWDFTKPHLFYIGKEPEKTEFMNYISGVQYDEADKIAIKTVIENLNLKIIHVNSLIENKLASGRLKDLSDVEHPKKIIEIRKKLK